MLKWAAQKDAAEYIKEQVEERRQSLQQRNSHAHHGRDVEHQIRQEELQQQHADEALAGACAKDVNGYKEKLRCALASPRVVL